MSKYLIVEKQNKLGKKCFNVKRKYLFIFYKSIFIGYETLKDSKEKIDQLIYWKENQIFKTIKKHKYNGPIR
jgi:hypothetical protein